MALHDGQVVLVTGAGSGIGKALSELVIAEGGKVVGFDLNGEGMAWMSDSEVAVTIVGDVTDPDDNARAVNAATEKFGRLDAAVLNAGLDQWATIDHPDAIARYRRAMDVNVTGVVLGAHVAVPAIRAAGGGSISITASVSGIGGDPGHWPYNAAKGAVTNLIRSLALELGPDIRVNGVAPGITRTGMTKAAWDHSPEDMEKLAQKTALKRWGTPEDQAGVHSFLISPAAAYVTGVIIPVDGGLTANAGIFDPA